MIEQLDERVAQAIAEIAQQRKALGIISSVAVVAKPMSASERARETDAESDGEVATMPRTEAMSADAGVSAPFDEDGPVWPSDASESAFLGEEKNQGLDAPRAGVQTLRLAAAEAEAALGPLPDLDALIARIPPPAREALEDLFRPKFTGVKRVSKDVLK